MAISRNKIAQAILSLFTLCVSTQGDGAGWHFVTTGNPEYQGSSACVEINTTFPMLVAILRKGKFKDYRCTQGKQGQTDVMACYVENGLWARVRWFSDKPSCESTRIDLLKDLPVRECGKDFDSIAAKCRRKYDLETRYCKADLTRQNDAINSFMNECETYTGEEQNKCNLGKKNHLMKMIGQRDKFEKKCAPSADSQKIQCMVTGEKAGCKINI